MIGAMLDDRLAGARLDNQGHWSKARQCLPELGSTALGAWLDRGGRRSALRSLGWSKARQPRALEQGSTGMIEAVFDDRLDGARLDNKGHRSKARPCLPELGLNGTWSKALQG